MSPSILRAACGALLFAGVCALPASAQDSRPESRGESRPAADDAESRPADGAPRRGRRRGGPPRVDREGGSAAAAAGTETRPEKAAAATSKPEAASRPASPFTAIVDGVVYTVSGPVLRKGTVLIKDDKIVDVGRDVVVPDGAKVIDARGKHVTPGLVAISCSGTFTSGFSPRGEEKPADQFDPFNQRMLMALSSGITAGCDGAFSGGPGMFGGLVRGARGGGSPTGLIAGFVGKHCYGSIDGVAVKEGAALVFQYGASDVLNKAATKDALRKAVDARKKRAEAASDPAKRDQKAETPDETTRNWIRVFDGDLPCVATAEEAADLVALAELSDEFDLPIVVAGGKEAWTCAARLGRSRLTFVLNPRNRDMYFNDAPNPFAVADNGWRITNAAALTETGLKWCVQPLGSSAGTGGLMGRDLLQLNMDAAFTVRGGVSEEEALASITLRPAQFLKVADRIGSLDIGKDADVVVMDLDPLDYRSFAETVLVNGRIAYEKDKVSFFNHVQTDRTKGLKGSWANER